MHEDYGYWKDCRQTERNRGLYLADQVSVSFLLLNPNRTGSGGGGGGGWAN